MAGLFYCIIVGPDGRNPPLSFHILTQVNPKPLEGGNTLAKSKKKKTKSNKTIKKPGMGQKIVDELIVSYWMEMETVQNYIANSTNLDGIRAKEIRESLAADIIAELGHAQRLAARIHTLGGQVPGSKAFKASQTSLQPPKDPTDVVSVIKGVIDAEQGAVVQYRKIIEMTEGADYATQDLAIELMADEQEHRREFVGFLAEYDKATARKLERIDL